jgi:NTE family protein
MSREQRTRLDLALQGGGAHGAFTWGVLDRLLETDRLDIEAISGTSAGAMNAVVMVSGYQKDGSEGARQALHGFWRSVSRASRLSPVQRTVVDRLMGNWTLAGSPGYLWIDLISRFVSPYQFNPLNLNPLKDILEAAVDFDAVRQSSAIRLFLSATNVHTGKVRVFETGEITPDVVMASACLPLMFQAVEIDGVPYWDGGYSGNPVLFPFFRRTETADILLVQINPIERPETPRTARDILNRMNEITFNGALLKELRAIEFVARLVEEGRVEPQHYRKMRIHRIDGGEALNQLDASSKSNAEWDFLVMLRDSGRQAATDFMAECGDRIGVESTADVAGLIS